MHANGLAARLSSSYKVRVLLLSVAQCLFVLSACSNAMFTALVGASLAPKASMATLPMSLVMFGTLATTLPLSLLMRRKGRRVGFMIAAGAGVTFAAVALFSVYERSFLGFCVSALIHGVYQAGAMYYRYAALEASPEHYRGRAVSYVIGGGLMAALVAPYLFTYANTLLEPVTFAGVYAVMIGVSLAAMALISVIPFPPPTDPAASDEPARPLRQLMKTPAIVAAMLAVIMAYALMMLLMTAAPLAMVGCGMPVSVASTAISWHMVAMFLPSFFSGRMVDRWGTVPVLMMGVAIFAASGLAAALGLELLNFSLALVGAGVGWNLMLTAGTVMLASGYRPSEQAKVQGVNESLAFTASALASFAAGLLMDWGGWAVIAIVSICITLMAAILPAVLAAQERKKRQAA